MKTLLSLTILLLTIPFTLADEPATAVDTETQAKLDKLHSSVQGICPVSGEKLGSHGQPIKVAIGEKKEQVFLCCEACKTGKLKAEHWGTIHKNIKNAQSACPVMGKPLPEKPGFTILNGTVVYVCCPPCVDKINAEPTKFLTKVNASYEKHMAAKSVPQ